MRANDSNTRDIIGWFKGDDIFQFTEKLVILKHLYERKSVDKVF